MGRSRPVRRTRRRPPSNFIVVVTNFNDSISESSKADNTGSAGLAVTLSPYADLAVSAVTAPLSAQGDPARVTVGWTVTNNGTGVGRTTQWTDKVVLSTNDTYEPTDRVIATFAHDGALGAGLSYSRSESILLPASLSANYRILVVTDAFGEVFENDTVDANNAAAAPNRTDVMLAPYADLRVSALSTSGTVASGQPLRVNWSVINEGIGTTDKDF
jgi:hypothetical protein